MKADIYENISALYRGEKECEGRRTVTGSDVLLVEPAVVDEDAFGEVCNGFNDGISDDGVRLKTKIRIERSASVCSKKIEKTHRVVRLRLPPRKRKLPARVHIPVQHLDQRVPRLLSRQPRRHNSRHIRMVDPSLDVHDTSDVHHDDDVAGRVDRGGNEALSVVVEGKVLAVLTFGDPLVDENEGDVGDGGQGLDGGVVVVPENPLDLGGDC